jgi:aerobic carbon-monoxide dehydrogenase medium subunit
VISGELEFHRPTSVSEAVELLGQGAEEGKVLAGGMSLVPAMNLGISRPTSVISLNHVSGLDYVEEEAHALRIGSMVRHARVESDSLIRRFCPLLGDAASLIGDVQVRNRGTIGGSVAHADPAADYLPVLVALGATCRAVGSAGERTIPARDFFRGVMETALAPDEVLVEIEAPKVPDGAGSAYLRLARLEGSFPIACAAAVVADGGGPVVAVGGATPAPVLVEAELARVEEAAYEACATAFGDLSATAEYRRAMAGLYARRAVAAALAARN